MAKSDNLIWIDLEMTGLDPSADQILEIATIVTDEQLTLLEEGPVIAIHWDEEVLSSMSQWCVDTHYQTGLVDRVRKSKVSLGEAEKMTLDFLNKYAVSGFSPMCGNSVGQDRRFISRYMPSLYDFFHYRNIDVSTLKELVRRWNPALLDGFVKQGTHLALEDIRESIEELRYYRKVFIQQ